MRPSSLKPVEEVNKLAIQKRKTTQAVGSSPGADSHLVNEQPPSAKPSGPFPTAAGTFRGPAERQGCLLDLGKWDEKEGLEQILYCKGKITEVRSYYKRRTSKQAVGAILRVKKYSLWRNV